MQLSTTKTTPVAARGGLMSALAVAVGLVVPLSGLVAGGDSGAVPEFTDVRRQTLEFIEYNQTISLTPEQEAVKREALLDLPAPCCKDRSAYTCCCNCNLAQSWWGLSKHLIADEGYDAAQVRAAVVAWFAFINPDGFSGDSCYSGRCAKPFRENGCGGMNDKEVRF